MESSVSIRELNDDKVSAMVVESGMITMLQERFCPANNVYCVCLNNNSGVLTQAYGTRAELDYLHGKIGMDRHISLMRKAIINDVEDVVEEDTGEEFLKMCALSIRVGKHIAATWIVLAVIEDDGVHVDEVPDCVKRTTTERFYASISFLEYLSKQYLAVKMEELIAQEAIHRNREANDTIRKELKKNGAMTRIAGMLESEDAFTDILDEILETVCEYLDISVAGVFQIDAQDERYMNMIAQKGCADGVLLKKMQRVLVADIPWADGKPYLISSDTHLPARFEKYFAENQRLAGIFLPIEVNDRLSMYITFAETEKKRVWNEEEIKFVNDVKHIIHSILTKRIMRNSLASSYASLEAILENMSCGIAVVESDAGRVLYSNHQVTQLLEGYLGQHSLEEFFTTYEADKDKARAEIFMREFKKWYDMQATRIKWVDGRNVMLYTIYDITDKKAYQQKIERQANNDFLTGLYNRMRFEQDLKQELHRTREMEGTGAMLSIDLDDFKNINDSLGHQYGDILLKAISNSLRRVKGVENHCYRIGGDEFVVLVTQENFHMLENILDEIQSVFSKPWFLHRSDYYCTMSMGIVRYPEDAATVTELNKKADLALYEAKNRGKNCIVWYNEKVDTASFRRLDMEKHMRDAAKNECEEFEVYFQPIIDITNKGGVCAGAEALVRWNSDKMGLIGPNEFIPLAEYLGLINPIGEAVLRKACKHCKYWNDMGHPEYHVNVNLSVVQLLQKDIIGQIRNILEETKLRPENLTLEVTESLAINDIDRMKQILAGIKELGAKIALDDFGTGYSSLSHIRELPIDVIKIDRCFVMDLGKDEYADVFIRMVAELADTLHTSVCIEGVEEQTQVDILKDIKGVKFIQGYYYDKPLPREIFEERYV